MMYMYISTLSCQTCKTRYKILRITSLWSYFMFYRVHTRVYTACAFHCILFYTYRMGKMTSIVPLPLLVKWLIGKTLLDSRDTGLVQRWVGQLEISMTQCVTILHLSPFFLLPCSFYFSTFSPIPSPSIVLVSSPYYKFPSLSLKLLLQGDLSRLAQHNLVYYRDRHKAHAHPIMPRSKDTDSDTMAPFNMNLLSIPSALITPVSCVNQSRSMKDLHKLGESEKVVIQLLVHVMKNSVMMLLFSNQSFVYLLSITQRNKLQEFMLVKSFLHFHKVNIQYLQCIS